MDLACLDCGTRLIRSKHGNPPKRCKSCAAKRHNRLTVERNRAKRLADPEASRAQDRIFRELVTARDLDRLLVRQRGECFYCAAPLDDDKHLDHVIPVVRGGRDAIGNFAFACPRCNHSKHARLLADFRREPFVML